MSTESATEKRRLWVFGDNILECERALALIAEALGAEGEATWKPSALYAPQYEIGVGPRTVLSTQLFPGYGRWGYDIQRHLRQMGAPVREATDAVIVDAATREILLAIEFCGALPAGNNAWQRCGRALACARAGVPYLYYAEIGGVELDPHRRVKAARFPNPIVPFAYLSLSQLAASLAAPVFTPSPTITASLASEFGPALGEHEALDVVREAILEEHDPVGDAVLALQEKAERAVHALADRRRRKDTLAGIEWDELAQQTSGQERLAWLLTRRLPWKKTTTIGAPSLKRLLAAASQAGVVAAGATDIPISLLAADDRPAFAHSVRQLYGDRVNEPFLSWLAGAGSRPLILVWIAGFKPRGDDSRPDRGLLPLAHMLFTDAGDYLAVVYGPAQEATWRRFEDDMAGLARVNGLWEALVGLSGAILVDSPTAGALRSVGRLTPGVAAEAGPPEQPFDAGRAPAYGEHDVDTVLHALFASGVDLGVFEGMCNPPGGDWSGISFQPTAESEVARWTSLPRVTKPGSKRPDHVVVIQGQPAAVLSIESKDVARAVERGIGPRLTAYVEGLLAAPPTISRSAGRRSWAPFDAIWSTDAHHFSAAAFRYLTGSDLGEVRGRASVDIVFAVEFHPTSRCTLHVLANAASAAPLRRVRELAVRFGEWLEVQEH